MVSQIRMFIHNDNTNSNSNTNRQ